MVWIRTSGFRRIWTGRGFFNNYFRELIPTIEFRIFFFYKTVSITIFYLSFNVAILNITSNTVTIQNLVTIFAS